MNPSVVSVGDCVRVKPVNGLKHAGQQGAVLAVIKRGPWDLMDAVVREDIDPDHAPEIDLPEHFDPVVRRFKDERRAGNSDSMRPPNNKHVVVRLDGGTDYAYFPREVEVVRALG